MRIPGLKTLRQSALWLRSRFVNSALILGYHRVADSPWDPYSLCVAPRHFAQQLEALRKHANPIPLQQLIEALKDGDIPPRTVAITFDDGYADVLSNAKPLLERYQTPATVFVTTGYMGREFWWDELEGILRPPKPLPPSLTLDINGVIYAWTLGHITDASSRTDFLLSLYELLRPLTNAERQKGMDQLRAWTGAPPADDPQQHCAITRYELVELATDGLVDIGSHTVTHPLLTSLSTAEQQFEIHQSKAHLEEILQRSITSFSYPNGSLSEETSPMLREAGFTCACTSVTDVAWRGSDRFHLPRFWIPNWDGARFSRWLKQWLHT